MDDRSTVKPQAAPSAERVHVDQVIFTSVRSVTAEGYRIIAASGGVKPEEKAEIIRRAPSHGSLCEAEPQARALSAYPLNGGRYCVALSQYAGVEHTARGGLRVHTHIVVLDQQDYPAFGCNAVRVYAALADAVGGKPVLDPPRQLDRLELPITRPKTQAATDVACAEDAVRFGSEPQGEGQPQAAEVLPILLGVLEGDEQIVTGASDRFDLLEQVLIALPLTARRSLAVSVGLNYSPSRRLGLCFVPRDNGETKRATRGRKVRMLDASAHRSRQSTSEQSRAYQQAGSAQQ
ncbi:MAG: hypothetical protein ABII12_12220 [Planctomycetota bacterium]